MKDYKLVSRAKKGDKDAFQQLIKKEKEKLYRMAFMYVKNEEDALDVFQETVYKAFTSIHSLKNNMYFSTWITRILINTALKHIEKSNRIVPVKKEVMEHLCGSHDNKELQYFELQQALNSLEEKYKTFLFLRYYEDFTVKKIADVLECPKGTVKTNIHRGLKALRIVLKEEDERERRTTII